MMESWFLLQEGFILYLAFFLALVGGAFGLPIPEDLPLFLAGIAVERDSVELGIVFPVCYIAIVLGDTVIFVIGRKLGPKIFNKPWFKKRFPPTKIQKVKVSLEKRSLLMIFIARHLFYLRTATFLTCGAVKMKFSRFIAADAIAALVSVPLIMSIGYIASEKYEQVRNSLQIVEIILGIVLAALVLIFYLIKKGKNRATE